MANSSVTTTTKVNASMSLRKIIPSPEDNGIRSNNSCAIAHLRQHKNRLEQNLFF